MDIKAIKNQNNYFRILSFILACVMIFSLISFTQKSEVHAASASTVDMSAVSGDVTITRDAINISASTLGGVITSGSAVDGITLTGDTSSYKVTISGQGSDGKNINVTLEDLSIITDGPIQLEDSANVQMSLKKENTLDSSDDNNIYPGLRVSSPNAISIGGEGKLTAKGYLGAGIGGYGFSRGTDQVAENGDNITIEDSVSVTAISSIGAGIGGGGANGDLASPTFGGSENIIIKDNAEVKAHSDRGAGVGGGGLGSGALGSEKGKATKNIQILGNTVVEAQGYWGAGIGGGQRGTGSDIRISENAVVEAQSGNGAGIGGGTGGSGSNIRISENAAVEASSVYNGAGIGGGGNSTGSNIEISGKVVVDAQSHNYGSGIGGGYRSSGSNIEISGGFVTSKGNIGDDIGNGAYGSGSSNITITGGSLYAVNNKISDTPTDGNGDEVYKVTVPAIQNETGDTLKGNLGITIPLSGSNTYKAKTISSGACEHRDSFPSDSAAAYIYLAQKNYEDISVGKNGNGFSDVVANPSIKQNIIYWEGYDISFDKTTGDEISFTTKSATTGNSYGNLPITTKSGYTFKGWFTEQSGGDKITSGSIVPASPPSTLYAHWSVNKYDVTFSAIDSDVSFDNKQVTYNSSYGELPIATKSGYTFKGWFTEQSGGDEITSGSIVPVSPTSTYYAHWSENKYDVTFSAIGADVSFDNKKVTYNSSYGELPIATKAGYTFKGWFTEQSGGDEITSGSIVPVSPPLTLYAHFEKIHSKFTVTLDPNGGKVKNNKITVTNESKYGSLATPYRTGYSFKGWYTSKSGGTKITSDTTVNLTKDQTLYAQWTANKYKVTFMGNKGKIKKSGKYKSSKLTKTKTFDTKYGTLPKAKRTGYKFKGWYTKKSGGKKITKNTIMKSTKNTKLYARWTPNGKITNCKWVHLRKGPGNSKIVKGYIKRGTKVSIIGKKKVKKHTWYKVKVDGKTGYIYSKYIKRV